ncbi:MAG TPA: hypothetical protein VFX21_16090 [Acidimicrobiia bacterium]|nr:hypothetical protein [Acidimicrobiia bacterium]
MIWLALFSLGVGIGAALAARWAWVKQRRNPMLGIDPMTLSMPWRQWVKDAVSARRRFGEVVATTKPGPIRERLAEIGGGIDTAVQEVWRVARYGDELDEGIEQLDLPNVTRRIERLEADGSADDAVRALKEQLASGERLRGVAADARQRLEVQDARLNEAVARAIELSLSASDVSELSGLGDDVETLVGDMEALRQGLEVARAASRGQAS